MSLIDYYRRDLTIRALNYFRSRFKKQGQEYKTLSKMLKDLEPKGYTKKELEEKYKNDGEFPG